MINFEQNGCCDQKMFLCKYFKDQIYILISTLGDHNYCSMQNLCAEDEGDCDTDSHCNSGLKCGKNNCPPSFGWPSWVDCCEKS